MKKTKTAYMRLDETGDEPQFAQLFIAGYGMYPMFYKTKKAAKEYSLDKKTTIILKLKIPDYIRYSNNR